MELFSCGSTATVEQLSEALQASPATIRRDLNEMAHDGRIIRIHGGAALPTEQPPEELPINVRLQLHSEEKEFIAGAALSLIQENSTVFIGPGTTTRALAAKIGRHFSKLTILTNDIDVAKEISHTDNGLIVTGGQLKKNSCTLYGFFTEQMLHDIKVDTAFLSVDAVDLHNGFMDFGVDEINIKRMVLKNAARCIMLCDVNKFATSAFVQVCPLSSPDIVVTNGSIPAQTIGIFQKVGVQVVLAAPKGCNHLEKE